MRPEAVSVAMHDPPPAARTPADVRHPERSLTAGRAVDQARVPFDVDGVGQVAARAGREVADGGVPLLETAGCPVQTAADGVPALLVPSPSPEDRHVIRVGSQLLAGASVAVDEPLQSPATLTAELIPARHLPSPSPLVTRLRTHSAPVHAHRVDAPGLPGPRARPGRTRRPARLPRPLGVPLRTAQTGGHSAACPGPMCVLDFAGLLADLPHMPMCG